MQGKRSTDGAGRPADDLRQNPPDPDPGRTFERQIHDPRMCRDENGTRAPCDDEPDDGDGTPARREYDDTYDPENDSIVGRARWSRRQATETAPPMTTTSKPATAAKDAEPAAKADDDAAKLIASERTRIQTILGCKEAEGHEDLAYRLALHTSLSAAKAISLLGAASLKAEDGHNDCRQTALSRYNQCVDGCNDSGDCIDGCGNTLDDEMDVCNDMPDAPKDEDWVKNPERYGPGKIQKRDVNDGAAEPYARGRDIGNRLKSLIGVRSKP